jgi:lantibiotic biosynthesis protein
LRTASRDAVKPDKPVTVKANTAGGVLVRVPAWPLRRVTDLYAADDLLRAIGDVLSPDVEWALYLASPELHRALREAQRRGSNDPDSQVVALRVLAYLVRMGFRPTPYGLFAGVALARAGGETTLALDAAWHTSTRFDAEWMGDRVRPLERRAFTDGSLRVCFADAVFERGRRLYLVGQRTPESSEILEADHDALVSVELTPVLAAIRAQTATPVTTGALAAHVAELAGAAADDAMRLLLSLWESGFLISELALTPGADPLGAATRLVNDLDPALGVALGDVRGQAARLDATPVAELPPPSSSGLAASAALFGTTVAKMLQIDALASLTGALGEHVVRTAERYAELMLRGGYAVEHARFRELFARAFDGHERLVPLMDFVEAAMSLRGEPQADIAPRVPKPERTRVLGDLVSRALRDGRLEVELDDRAREVLYPALPDEGELPISLDVAFQVIASDVESVAAGRYVLCPSGLTAGTPRNSVIARFAGALGYDMRSDGPAEPGIVDAELIYSARQERADNLGARCATCEFEIAPGMFPSPDGSPRRIALSDIYVGLDREGRFALHSASLGRRIRVRQTSMLSWRLLAPPVCYVLRLVAEDGARALSPFDWGPFHEMPFRPRVRDGNIVLSPAAWRIADVLTPVAPDLAEFERSVRAFAASAKLPRYVSMVESYNKFLVDLESPSGIALFHDQLKRAKSAVHLEEAIPAPGQTWLAGPDGTHVAEIVVGFDVDAPRRAHEAVRPVAAAARLSGPAGEWLYAQLSASLQSMDTLLRTEIAALVHELELGAEPWFFVRYAIPEPHLRLRFRLRDERKRRSAIERFERMTAQQSIRRYALATYERELERYGGPESLAQIERVFAVSSRWALIRLRLKHKGKARVAGCVHDAVLLAQWLFGANELERLVQVTRPAAARKSVGWERELLRELARPQPGDWRADDRATVTEVARSLRDLARDGTMSRSPVDVFPLLVHMHANRLGIFGRDEEQVVALVWHALFSASRRDAAAGKTPAG